MYNYPLLKELGKTSKPVLLKRAFSASIKEWILAAEHIEQEGNQNIILCERGIRTFENSMRNTLDLASAALVKQQTHYPVFIDPSHGTGMRELVAPMTYAAAAIGADGVMIEVHDDPGNSLSDGHQALSPEQLAPIIKKALQIRSLFLK